MRTEDSCRHKTYRLMSHNKSRSLKELGNICSRTLKYSNELSRLRFKTTLFCVQPFAFLYSVCTLLFGQMTKEILFTPRLCPFLHPSESLGILPTKLKAYTAFNFTSRRCQTSISIRYTIVSIILRSA